jgi:NTE family protein
MDKASASPSVAIAFGGGGARGLAHIHVIEALDELGIRPVMIAGSSIGAIMGAGMAAGMSGRDIREFTLSTVGNKREVMNRLWSLRPTTIQEFVSGGGIRVGHYNLERILKAFLPEQIPETFEELAIPLSITATDYYGQCECTVQSGELIKAIAASAAIPAVFMPVKLDGRVMIDGGVINPVPFDHLVGKADIIIGVDAVGGPEGEDQVPNRIDSLFGASQLMMQSIISEKLVRHAPHIFLRPNIGKFKVLDFLKAAEVLETSASAKDDFKRALDAQIEFHARTGIIH